MDKTSTVSILTDEQQRQVCAVLSVGCDRETAVHYADCTLADFHRQMVDDRKFAAEVRRAEATNEVKHMRNVQSAAQEEKNWRASVWWLERRAPERYGRRDAGALTPREMQAFVAMLISMVVDEVRNSDDLRRLLARFDEAVRSLQEWGHDQVESADPLRLPAPEGIAGDSIVPDDANDIEISDDDSP